MPRIPTNKDRVSDPTTNNAAVNNAAVDTTPDVNTSNSTGVNSVDVDPNPNAGTQPQPGGNVADTHTAAPGTLNPIDVQGTVGGDNTGIQTAQLNPSGKPVELNVPMKAVVGGTEKLNLAVMNRDFNPYRDKVGDFTDAAQAFQGKAFIPTQKLIGGVAKAGGADDATMAALGPLLAALPETSTYISAAHQFAINGANKPPGNRVVLYGGNSAHNDIDVVVRECGKQGMRLLKVMAHVNHEGQGGSIDQIVADAVAGVTHTGGFSLGMRGGKTVSIKSDWPPDYGHLSDGNVDYNAHLIAVDYQAGTNQPVPKKTIGAWKQNADMIDAFAGIVFPFANDDLDPRYTNYKFNPLEVHDSASASSVLKSMAKLDTEEALKDHGAFYCAEGQFSVASMGWQKDCLVKKSEFADTAMGKCIEEFQNAPGLERNAEGQVTNPEVGWQHLEDKNLITARQHNALKETDRTAVALEWVPEDVKGAQDYGCKNSEGMVAEPMSVATMAWGLLRTYMPREGMAKQMAGDIMKAFKEGTPEVQAGLTALLGGKNPITAEGQQALGGLCMKAASGLLLQVLGSDEFRDNLFGKAGFNEITNQPDKDKVTDLYKKFIGTLQSTDLTNQGALDKALQNIDQEFKDLRVEREDFDPRTGQTTGVRQSVMMYAAPQCNMYWTQQPDVFESVALRYVATAMHTDQAGQ